jgi:hypothetical protein
MAPRANEGFEPRGQWDWLDARGERAIEGTGQRPVMYIALGTEPKTEHPFNLYTDIMSIPRALADTLSDYAGWDADQVDSGEFLTSQRNWDLSRTAFFVYSGSGRTVDANRAAEKAGGLHRRRDLGAVQSPEQDHGRGHRLRMSLRDRSRRGSRTLVGTHGHRPGCGYADLPLTRPAIGAGLTAEVGTIARSA